MKPFDLKQIIQDRVNKEAEIEHANDPRPAIPKYSRSKVEKKKAGWTNFFMNLKVMLP